MLSKWQMLAITCAFLAVAVSLVTRQGLIRDLGSKGLDPAGRAAAWHHLPEDPYSAGSASVAPYAIGLETQVVAVDVVPADSGPEGYAADLDPQLLD